MIMVYLHSHRNPKTLQKFYLLKKKVSVEGYGLYSKCLEDSTTATHSLIHIFIHKQRGFLRTYYVVSSFKSLILP